LYAEIFEGAIDGMCKKYWSTPWHIGLPKRILSAGLMATCDKLLSTKFTTSTYWLKEPIDIDGVVSKMTAMDWALLASKCGVHMPHLTQACISHFRTNRAVNSTSIINASV